jgi:hypothetical protein
VACRITGHSRKKIRNIYEVSGEFGVLLTKAFDNTDNKEGRNRSMQLPAEEVLPQVADLAGES